MKYIFYILTIFFFTEAVAQTDTVSITSTIGIIEDSTAKTDTLIMKVPYFIPDSVLAQMDTVSATAKWQESPPSVFAALNAGKIITNPTRKHPVWLFVIFILQLFILVYIKITSIKKVEESVKAYFNINLSQQLFREQESAVSFSVLLQMINFIISCTVMLYLLVDYFFQPPLGDSLKIAAAIFMGTTAIYFFKYIGYRILSVIFPFSEEIDLFRFNYFLNQKLLGILLVPLVYSAAYSPAPYSYYVLSASIALFILCMGIRSVKGLVIGSRYLQRNTFHFLLYICTFEIAPVLVLVKWLQLLGYGQN